MGEGTGQPDNTPRPDDATIIGGDATVVDGETGMPETVAGYDATAAEYQAQLDAITSGMEEPAAP